MGLEHCPQNTNGTDRCFLLNNSVVARPPCTGSSGECTSQDVMKVYGTPTLPTDCDKERIRQAGNYDPNAVNQPQPNLGGGGFGGGGGSSCDCGDCNYGCSGGGSGGPGRRECTLSGPIYDGECGTWDPSTGTCTGSDPTYEFVCTYNN